MSNNIGKKLLPGQDEDSIKIREKMSKIKHKVIVISGKGGVGKSTVATNLAYALMKLGKKVGLLDIDLHGPSIGKMTGIEGKMLSLNDDGTIQPVEKDNVLIITMASLLQNPEQPVIWRGPLKIKAIKQFLGDINWGELDWLVIDSPPGTGDEPLSIAQLIPDLDGSIVVSTPQEVALIDARKTVRFSQILGVKVLGIIENMSGFVCPHCNEKTNIFKVGGARKASSKLGIEFLSEIPIELAIMESGETGNPYVLSHPNSETAKKFLAIAQKIAAHFEEVHE